MLQTLSHSEELLTMKVSKKELTIIRNFFTDEQWDVIDAALNEFQDHDGYEDILDTIGEKLQSLFNNNSDDTNEEEFTANDVKQCITYGNDYSDCVDYMVQSMSKSNKKEDKSVMLKYDWNPDFYNEIVKDWNYRFPKFSYINYPVISEDK